MKNLILTILFSMTSTLVMADVGAASSLKDNMKLIGTSFKQVNATVNDASKNADNLVLVGKMLAAFQVARTQMPDGMPTTSMADYQSLMDQEIQNLTDLQTALQKNDNVAALAILQKMNTLKKEGHDKYKQ